MKIKNWEQFQHFKDRRPPWIKLYREILDDIEWHKLPAESAKVLVMLWLIASEADGDIPNVEQLAFRLRMTEQKTKACLSTLSHWLIQDDIKVISERYQDDAPETERETEKEREAETEAPAPTLDTNGNGKDHGPTPEDLVDLWNKAAHPNLPRVQLLTEGRKRHARNRLDEYPAQAFWQGLLERINRSPLLRGDKGDWKANFDWILQPANFAKILEGNYDPDKRR